MAGWKPNLGFQTIGLDARYVVDEMGFFGDRGGGKTGLILADYAINIQEHPDPKTKKILPGPCRPWKGILFRRHYKEFETIIERSKEVFYGLFGNRDQGGRAKYLEGDKKWVFYDKRGSPYHDVFLTFFHMEHDSDVDQHVGQEYCVALGTPVKMGDGTLKNIEDIRVGDEVMTLNGPQHVFRTFKPKLKMCVRADVFDEQGQLIGQQVHPASHPILSAFGWKSYASIQESYAKESAMMSQDVLRHLSVTVPVMLHAPQIPSNQFCEHQRNAIQFSNLYKHFEWYGNKHPKSLQPVFENMQGHQQAVAILSEIQDRISLLFSSNGGGDGLSEFQTVEDSRFDYLTHSHLCGEQLLLGEEYGPNGVPLQGDVATPFQTSYDNMDDGDCIQECNPVLSGLRYNHPYTGEQVQSSEQTSFGACNLTPIGLRWTLDLSVENVGHYLTESNLINRNCWVGFDELPHWPNNKPYLKMFASVRSGKAGIPSRVRSTGNPGAAGIGWVKQRFGIPDGPKEVVKTKSCVPMIWKDPRSGKQLVRMFLLSLREENLPLRQNDPLYDARLAASVEGDPDLEKAWLDADFSALFGQYFKVFSPEIHRVNVDDIFPDGRVPPFWKLYGHLDYGENAPTAFGLWAVDPNYNKYLIEDYYQAGEWVGYHAGAIKDIVLSCSLTNGRMPQITFADSQIWHTRAAENVTARNRTIAKIFENETGLRLRPSIKGAGSRVRGWRYFKQCLSYVQDEKGQMIKKPSIYYLSHCTNWEREVQNAVFSDTGDKEDIDKRCDDHHLTGTIYFLGGSQKAMLPQVELPPEASYATLDYYKKQQKNRKFGRTVETFMVPDNRTKKVDDSLTKILVA